MGVIADADGFMNNNEKLYSEQNQLYFHHKNVKECNFKLSTDWVNHVKYQYFEK